ncbi:MAG: hypothetical protein ACP5G1_01190 [Nanopusillaceae archaeon]
MSYRRIFTKGKKTFLIIVFLTFFALLIYNKSYSLKDAFVIYCEYGGGKYYSNSTGEYCIVNGVPFDIFQYYMNEVPPEYSFCAHYNLSLVREEEIIDGIIVNNSYCQYPNGTLIIPQSLLPEGILKDIDLSFYTNKTNCTSILECPDKPWLVPECSSTPYPCFEPPYIPNIPPNYNKTDYQKLVEAYRKEVMCGYCPPNSTFNGNWYRCPNNFSLLVLYASFEYFCPPPNTIKVTCTGTFICINNTNNTETATTNINLNLVKQNITETKSSEFPYKWPIAIAIVIIIVALLLLLYYLR